MEKEIIVSRPICDKVVQERLLNDDDMRFYVDSIPLYKRNVKVTLPRVELNKSNIGMRKYSIAESLRNTYENMELPDKETEAVVRVSEGGKTVDYPASYEELRMLKALAVEQINCNGWYAKVVGLVFVEMMTSIFKGEHVTQWNCGSSFTDAQAVIFNALTKYVDSVLGVKKLC